MSFAKTIEISADSTQNFDDAIKQGVKKANETLENLKGVWVKDQEILLNDGSIAGYRVHLKVTFQLS